MRITKLNQIFGMLTVTATLCGNVRPLLKRMTTRGSARFPVFVKTN